MRVFVATFGHIASWVTIFVALFNDSFGHLGQFKYALILIVSVYGVFAVRSSWKDGKGNVYRTCKNQQQINTALKEWISDTSNICIVSRNMSWADDDDIDEILLKKSRTGDLEIYAESETNLTTRLQKSGANLMYYGESGFVPECRFTFRKFRSKDAELAIAHLDAAGNHIIYRYTSADGPVFHLARDLTRILGKA